MLGWARPSVRLKQVTKTMDTKFAFMPGIIPDCQSLTQSGVVKRLSGKDSFGRKWLTALDLRLSNACRDF